MEKLADRIEDFLEKQLGLYEALQSVVEKEKKQIVDMDSDALWKTIGEKKEICHDIERGYIELKKSLKSNSAGPVGDEETFSLSDLIQKLPISSVSKSKLRQMVLGVELHKKEVFTIAAANKQYVQDSLAVIDEIFSQSGKPENAGQYNPSGQSSDQKNPIRLISTEV